MIYLVFPAINALQPAVCTQVSSTILSTDQRICTSRQAKSMFQDEWIKIANMLKHCKNENPYIIVFHICIMSNMLFSSLIDHVKAILHTSAMKHGPYTYLLFLMTVKKLKVHNINNSNNSLFIYSVFIFVFIPESIRPD